MKTGHWRGSGYRGIGSGGGTDGDAVGNQQVGECCAGDVGCSATANREVLRIDQPVAGQSLRCGGGDSGVIGHVDVRRRGFDETATAAIGRTGVQSAAHFHRAAFHAAHQLDDAVDVLQRLRLNHAGVVDCIGQQAACRLGGHQHLATVGPEQPAVFNQRVDHALIDGDTQELVACDVERDCAACGQGDGAQLG